MAAVYSFSLHSVIHNDMHSGNIFISPNQIVLINFGQAILKGDIEDDDKHWAKKVELEEEVEALDIASSLAVCSNDPSFLTITDIIKYHLTCCGLVSRPIGEWYC